MIKKLKVMIIDDEQAARLRLARLLETHANLECIGEASDGLQALRLISELKPDVVFLDIEMPEFNGLEVARALGVHGPLIVFVTAYDQYALAAFESSAIDYVVKPVHAERLALALEKIQRLNPSSQQKKMEVFFSQLKPQLLPMNLAFRIGQHFEIVKAQGISVIRALDHYSQVIVGDKEYLSEESIDSLADRLKHLAFLRVHRSALINLDFIAGLRRLGDRKYVVDLNDFPQSEVKISRERLPELKRRLGLDEA
jgi:two-component system LytT family response regulator